ncbi:MAG: DUF6250 domain-containing protein [Chitinophagaceae bacterium]
MITKLLNPAVFIGIGISLFSCKSVEKTIYDKSFLIPRNWVVEQQEGGKVNFINNTMEITDAKGCTIWFKNKIKAPVKIEFDVTVIDNDGQYDRVSDMNCFWMANDPKNPNNFFKESENRKGFFPNYHGLTLYYVGYGGHDNTKTRFRRYDGNVDRPLLPEHDLSDKKFFITANKKMHFEIVVKDSLTSYSRNGVIIFEITDSQPYTQGYFGFRTVENHELIENFKVIKLQ